MEGSCAREGLAVGRVLPTWPADEKRVWLRMGKLGGVSRAATADHALDYSDLVAL